MDMNIECAICAKICKGQVTGGHLKTHGLNTKEYEIIYGSSKHPLFMERQRVIGSSGGGGNSIAAEAAKLKASILRSQYEKSSPKCPLCSKIIPYEKRANVYCSGSCAAQVNNSKREKQGKCTSCSAIISRFRSFCSHQCQANNRKSIRIGQWLSGQITGGKTDELQVSATIRTYLIEQANHACTLCGWDKINPKTGNCPLHIDHINGDCTDHRPDNLRVICPNCHSLTETYGALNRDNKGRTVRRKERLRQAEDERLIDEHRTF